MTQLNNPHDRFFKTIFGRSEVAREFLQRYLPPEVAALIDWRQLQPEKDQFIDSALQGHANDLLYRIQLHSGKPGYIHLLFEHKSYPEYRINLDLMRYRLQIWEQWRSEGNRGKLPVILPLVFYHGAKPWNIAQEFAETVAKAPELKAYIPHARYHLVDLSKYTDEELKGAVILRVALLLLKHIFDNQLRERLPGIFALLRELNEDSSGLDFIHTLLRYLSQVTSTDRLTPEELRQAVTHALSDRSDKSMTTIAEYWKEEGREEGQQRTLKKLIQLKFGEVPSWVEERLAKADSEQLDAWTAAILSAESLDRLLEV